MTASQRDPHEVLATLAERRASFELGTLDLCFLCSLYLRGRSTGLSEFNEGHLLDAFEYVCDAFEPGAENVRARATHAIRRLREQRLLSRVDGAGILRAGEYALTRLATGIVEFFVEDETLTQETLTLLTRSLLLGTADILSAARRAQTAADWRSHVAAPLRVSVGDLVAGIERRQRGLDLQQEEFQKQISDLLGADWFGAVDRCQELLATTATTLRELNETLLHDGHQLSTVLQDILALAAQAEDTGTDTEEAQRSVHHALERVDRVAAWGSARQQAWSEYYEYVHRYLRDVVRLDPARAITQRLRQLLASDAGQSYRLTVASTPALRVLRDLEPVEEPPPVRRPKPPRETELEETEAGPDPMKLVEQAVRAQIEAGNRDLCGITRELTRELPDAERFMAAGRIAQALAHLTRPLCRQRPWTLVEEGLAIEQWFPREAPGG